MKKLLICFTFFIPFWTKAQIITTIAARGVFDPNGVVADHFGNVYFCEAIGYKIMKIDTSSTLSIFAGTGSSGYSGDGGAATSALLNVPDGIDVDTLGNLYFADANNFVVRKINVSTGIISTIAGNHDTTFSGDGGQATAAGLDGVTDVKFDKHGNLFIACNSRIRKIDTSGIITTIAGDGTLGDTGDGGAATNAEIGAGWLNIDDSGNIYFSCTGAIHIDVISKIRKINTAGIISRYAGLDSSYVYNGDGIPATSAQLCPTFLARGRNGFLYIGDQLNNRVRMIDSAGIIHTIAGNGIVGTIGDGGPADSARLDWPAGITFDTCGNLYICDVDSPRIRKVWYLSTDTPSISISLSGSDTLCSGTSATYIASCSGGGSITAYQWYKNDTPITTATSSAYTYAPANGDSIQCILTTSNRCSSPSYGYSNVIHMVVNPSDTPTIFIHSSPGDTVCTGRSVIYTATITGGGTSPAYQWVVNGAYVGTGGSSYSYVPSNGDSIRCVFASSATCVSSSSVSSSTIHMVVNPLILPSISIAPSPGDTVCAGTHVTYSAAITGGGSAPAYRWLVDGSVVSTAGSSYSYTPSTGDSIRCILTSNVTCPAITVVSSNTINMLVDPIVIPFIHITAHPGDTVCNVDAVTFSETDSGGGSSALYQWLINGAVVSTTGGSYTYSPTTGDSVWCIIVSNALCARPDTISSNKLHMSVASLSIPTIVLSAPAVVPIGSPVTVTATVTGAGSSYVIHWMNDGIEFTTTTIPSVTYTKTTATDSITAKIVSNDYCYDSTISAVQIILDHNASIPVLLNSRDGEGVTCYPNPATLQLYISAGFDIESIVITNMVGQVVLQSSVFSGQSSVCDVRGLVSGVYFVKVYPAFSAGVGGVYVEKFVKE